MQLLPDGHLYEYLTVGGSGSYAQVAAVLNGAYEAHKALGYEQYGFEIFPDSSNGYIFHGLATLRRDRFHNAVVEQTLLQEEVFTEAGAVIGRADLVDDLNNILPNAIIALVTACGDPETTEVSVVTQGISGNTHVVFGGALVSDHVSQETVNECFRRLHNPALKFN